MDHWPDRISFSVRTRRNHPRSRFDRVVVKPTWAKLIDFETTLPTAIEELKQRQKDRQRA